MKGSNKFLTIAVILLLIINVAMLVFMLKGKRRGADKKQGGKAPFEKMAEELKMTEQQQTQFKQMKEEHLSAISPVFDSIRALKKSLFNLVKEENATDSMVSKHSLLIAEQQAIVDKTTINHFRKVRALFTGDQQKEFDEFMQKMTQRRKGGPGGKGGGDSADKKRH